MELAALIFGLVLIVAIYDSRDASSAKDVPINEWWKIRSYMEDGTNQQV